MLQQDQINTLSPKIKSLQIICFALISGVFVFAIVASATIDWKLANTQLSVLAITALAMTVGCVPASFIVPQVFGNAQISKATIQDKNQESVSGSRLNQLMGLFNSQTIVRFALLEGPAFMCVIVFFIDQNLIALASSVFLLGIMLFSFPLENRVHEWIEDQIGSRP